MILRAAIGCGSWTAFVSYGRCRTAYLMPGVRCSGPERCFAVFVLAGGRFVWAVLVLYGFVVPVFAVRVCLFGDCGCFEKDEQQGLIRVSYCLGLWLCWSVYSCVVQSLYCRVLQGGLVGRLCCGHLRPVWLCYGYWRGLLCHGLQLV